MYGLRVSIRRKNWLRTHLLWPLPPPCTCWTWRFCYISSGESSQVSMTSKVWGSYCLYKTHQISYCREPGGKEQLNTFKENLLSWKAAISKYREIHVAFYSSWKYDVLTLRRLKEGRAPVTFIFLSCHAWRGWLGYCWEARFWDVN